MVILFTDLLHKQEAPITIIKALPVVVQTTLHLGVTLLTITLQWLQVEGMETHQTTHCPPWIKIAGISKMKRTTSKKTMNDLHR